MPDKHEVGGSSPLEPTKATERLRGESNEEKRSECLYNVYAKTRRVTRGALAQQAVPAPYKKG